LLKKAKKHREEIGPKKNVHENSGNPFFEVKPKKKSFIIIIMHMKKTKTKILNYILPFL